MRAKRLYRARAWYPLHGGGEYAITRHFQTKAIRDRWAQTRREGRPAEEGPYIGGGEYADRPALPPALRVEVTDSKPIEWEEGER